MILGYKRFVENFYDKKNLYIILVLFIYFNSIILTRRSELLLGGSEYNTVIKYAIIMNNTVNITFFFSLVYGIFLGLNLLSKNISTGQISIILAINPNRKKYIISEWCSVVLMIIIVISMISVNTTMILLSLKIQINLIEILSIMGQLIINSVLVMTVTLTFSMIFSEITSLCISLIYIVAFNIYAYGFIPFIELRVQLTNLIVKILSAFFPINFPIVNSLLSEGYVTPINIQKILSLDIWEYQILYIGIVLLIAIFLFDRKEL